MLHDPRLDAKSNLKQLLLARADWFSRELEQEISRSAYADLRPAESRLLAYMAGKPCHMAELARRLGVSRQAVHKVVAGLVKRGVLELADDPERPNAKLVLYTERGREVNRGGARLIEKIEDRISRAMGDKHLAQLKALLSEPW
jgi:DNA-binding MarR family transcriptional regulator